MLWYYKPEWLRHDITAGLVLTAMLVPVGIAYAEASGVPGIYGLYATIVPLLAYAIFGPSKILVLGPDSALAAVILAVILPLSGGDAARAVVLAASMAVVSGLIRIAAGLARLGFITERYAPNEQELIAACRTRLTKGNAKLDPSLPTDKLISAWRLWVPTNWAREKPSDRASRGS